MLPDKPTLADFKKYIAQKSKERGFAEETVEECFMLLLEEAGEFAKAARKLGNVKVDKNSRVHDVEEEAADILWILNELCIRLNIDLEKAFRAKEEKNNQRTWGNYA